RRHVLRASGTLQLPHGMQASAILDLRSSLPFNPASNIDINKDGYAQDIPLGVDYRSGCRGLNMGAINAFRGSFNLAPVSSVACPGYQDI
ncbi:hypothetical protein, partial [Klebsiella pneumoniae]|uniref:hypothetical protein n=1 Tax=Klebsiella pneumoniae TaxID=573 RepID=UPI0030134D9D